VEVLDGAVDTRPTALVDLDGSNCGGVGVGEIPTDGDGPTTLHGYVEGANLYQPIPAVQTTDGIFSRSDSVGVVDLIKLLARRTLSNATDSVGSVHGVVSGWLIYSLALYVKIAWVPCGTIQHGLPASMFGLHC
jgi:hypothetical protein